MDYLKEECYWHVVNSKLSVVNIGSLGTDYIKIRERGGRKGVPVGYKPIGKWTSPALQFDRETLEVD